MTNDIWLHLPINPDPWEVGPLGVGRRNGKMYPYIGPSAQLKAYQEAIREELESQSITMLEGDFYKLTFYFWRRLDEHEKGRKVHADATNMQKATEDALQGILIGNDRNVLDIRSRIVAQGPGINGRVVIHAEYCPTFDDNEIPQEIWDKIIADQQPRVFDNSWGGPTHDRSPHHVEGWHS